MWSWDVVWSRDPRPFPVSSQVRLVLRAGGFTEWGSSATNVHLCLSVLADRKHCLLTLFGCRPGERGGGYVWWLPGDGEVPNQSECDLMVWRVPVIYSCAEWIFASAFFIIIFPLFLVKMFYLCFAWTYMLWASSLLGGSHTGPGWSLLLVCDESWEVYETSFSRCIMQVHDSRCRLSAVWCGPNHLLANACSWVYCYCFVQLEGNLSRRDSQWNF